MLQDLGLIDQALVICGQVQARLRVGYWDVQVFAEYEEVIREIQQS